MVQDKGQKNIVILLSSGDSKHMRKGVICWIERVERIGGDGSDVSVGVIHLVPMCESSLGIRLSQEASANIGVAEKL